MICLFKELCSTFLKFKISCVKISWDVNVVVITLTYLIMFFFPFIYFMSYQLKYKLNPTFLLLQMDIYKIKNI